MRELTWATSVTAICSFVGGFGAWLFNGTVWIGAIIGAAIPVLIFVGATLAVLGLIQMFDDFFAGR